MLHTLDACLLAWSEMWFGDCSSTYRGIFPYNKLHVALTLMWFDGLYHNTKRSEYSTHINTDFHIVDLILILMYYKLLVEVFPFLNN